MHENQMKSFCKTAQKRFERKQFYTFRSRRHDRSRGGMETSVNINRPQQLLLTIDYLGK